MPRPVYILCSESGAQDARTGLLSVFNIIERWELEGRLVPVVRPAPEAREAAVPIIPIHVVAVWSKTPDDDPEQEFEHEFALAFPGGEELVGARSTHQYFRHDDRPLNRYMIDVKTNRLSQPGIFRVESRIRPIGSDDWLHQEYQIPILAPVPDADGGETNAHDPGHVVQ